MKRLHLWHTALLILEFNLHFIPHVTFDSHCSVLDNVSWQSCSVPLCYFINVRIHYDQDAVCFYSVKPSTADTPLFSPISIQESGM